MPLDVLYEDNQLLVVAKPAGVATQGAAPGDPSLLDEARRYIKQRYNKPGNVYLGVVSRLDALVTGVMVLARTSKAAARLTEQFRSRAVEKVYWALVEGSPPQAVDCHDFLIKNDRQQRMVVCDPQMVGAQEARLHLHRLAAGRGLTLVEIVLETGRKHQIRVQLSSRGWCVLGDRKYGSHFDWPLGIALHARRLRFEHPTRHEMLDFVAPLPAAWQRRGVGETGQID